MEDTSVNAVPLPSDTHLAFYAFAQPLVQGGSVLGVALLFAGLCGCSLDDDSPTLLKGLWAAGMVTGASVWAWFVPKVLSSMANRKVARLALASAVASVAVVEALLLAGAQDPYPNPATVSEGVVSIAVTGGQWLACSAAIFLAARLTERFWVERASRNTPHNNEMQQTSHG